MWDVISRDQELFHGRSQLDQDLFDGLFTETISAEVFEAGQCQMIDGIFDMVSQVG